jgi:hypothetical protein
MTIEIPEKLKREDIRFIRIIKNTKKPMDPNWNGIDSNTQYKFNDKILQDWLQENNNYGIICGNNNLIVIDVDENGQELHDYIEQNLPKTFTVKTWSPKEYKKHYYYWNPNYKLMNLDVIDKNNNIIHYGEIRGVNVTKNNYTQVVGPGSHIINSEKNIEGDYQVIRDLNIVNINDNELDEMCKRFATKAILHADKIKRETIKFDDYNIESTLNLINLIDISKLNEKNNGCYMGSHPIHGSTTGTNFYVDTINNIWCCFRHMSCGGGIASWIAVKEGLIDCSQTNKKLDKEIYKKVIQIAKIKYNFNPPIFNTNEAFQSNVKIDIEEKIKERKKELSDSKPWIELPHDGKLISEFADEVAEIIKDKNEIFFRPESRDIIEVGNIIDKDKNEDYLGFIIQRPPRFITLAERYFTPYKIKKTQYETTPLEKSMTSDISNTLLSSANLQNKLLKIRRIFTIPIPILYNNTLTFPKKGYDERFYSWRPYDSPEITNPDMSIEEAKNTIHEIFNEFCFQTNQDYTNAIAALLTPFLRGLYPSFSTRSPLFFYIANRERAGKDYCAGITGIVYEGFPMEEPPISNTEASKGGNNDELKKKILAAMINGRKRLHFSNNKGYIDNAILEAIITAEKYSDRLLGRNEILTFDNEIDFSLSGNVGIGFTSDLKNRSRFIRLFLEIENANERKFKNPNLHATIKKNRELILSALYSLIKNWIILGMPAGKTPFTSFPEWARVCGGIMEAAGYNSPCEKDKIEIEIGGDDETRDMKILFELCYENFPEKWIKKDDILNILMKDDSNIFCNLDLNKRGDQTKFGLKLSKFIGRILSDIRLRVKDNNTRASRQEFKFTKDQQLPTTLF